MKDSNFFLWVGKDWRRNRKLFIIQTTAFLVNISSYIYMTFALPNPDFLIAYSMYVFGSSLSIVYSIGVNSFPLLLTNLSYLVIEAFGLLKILQY